MAKMIPNLVPDRVAQHRHYPRLLQVVRVVQFVSSIISLALFARYLATLATAISRSNGAVIGILAASVVWVLLITMIGCLVPLGGTVVRLLAIFFDTAFVGAFIGVAALTSPGMGRAGQCSGSEDEDNDNDNAAAPMMAACNLVAGTFGLSIVSTFMHTISALGQQGNVSSPSKINNPLSRGGNDIEVAQTSRN